MSNKGIGNMLVSSRSFDEYVAMFSLDDADLSSTILDCPAGAASFTAGARKRGALVTACDRVYTDKQSLMEAARAETIRGNEYVSANAGDFSGTFFRDARHHLEHRLDAVDRFADDCTAHPESYVAGTLPELPFADRSFDLVVSSHLLFTYGDSLDVETHHAYLSELVRVAREEVRVFPLMPMGSPERYPHLDILRRLLAESGIETGIVAVEYEFQRGGNEMLVCRRA